MKSPMKNLYTGYRYAATIISHVVWLYHRFTLTLGDVEEFLVERCILVSDETVRQWCLKFGSQYAVASPAW